MNAKAKISFPLFLVLFSALFVGTTCSALASGFELQLSSKPLISDAKLDARLDPSSTPASAPPVRQLVSVVPRTYVIPTGRRAPVGQQGDCISADAWAVAQMVTTIAWQKDAALKNYLASPMFLFRDVGKRECTEGWTVSDALKATTRKPVRMDFGGAFETPGLPTRSVIATRTGALETKEQMRKLLASDIPLAASFPAFPGLNRYSGGIYSEAKARAAMTSAEPAPRGRHTVMVIGYHTGGPLRTREFFQRLFGIAPSQMPESMNLPPFWVFQNSWGTDWGFGGYGLMAVGEPASGPLDAKMWWIADVAVQ